MRLFMIQHDCGHGAFFRNRLANDWAGRAISVLTLTPYDAWRRAHAQHHAGAGNLHRRGIGDIDTLTRSEEHTSDTPVTNAHLVCRLLLEKKKTQHTNQHHNILSNN